MTEEFLQFVWKHKLFKMEGIQTTQGEPLEIVNAGKSNHDAGPDFFNASIRIGDTLWAGNVEIHKKSSDWLLHGHQNNAAYNNVILHVVFENDTQVNLPNGQPLPLFIPEFDAKLWKNYAEMLLKSQWPACAESLHQIDPIYISSTFHSMLIERMQVKTQNVLEQLQHTQNDWNETFYRQIARNMGFKTNAQPFEMLALKTPLKVLSKYKNNLFQLEAILFGQSGLLNEQLLGDDYFLKLREEYAYLTQKHNLTGVETHVWKFLRLRPANFPTIRIAQFAALVNQSESLFSKLIESESIAEIKNYFRVKASEYWDIHYKFNTQTGTKTTKWLGNSSIDNLLINTVAPFLFIYGERNNKENLKDKAIELLESIDAEKNNITERWSHLGVKAQNAFDSQALIQLKNVYCDAKRCLKCQLGNKVINCDQNKS